MIKFIFYYVSYLCSAYLLYVDNKDQYNPSLSLSNETSKCLGMLYSSCMTELTILKNTQFNR